MFGNSGRNLRKSRYQSFLVLPSFARFYYFWQSILSLNVWQTESLLITRPSLFKTLLSYSLSKRLCLTFRGNINKMIWGKSFKFCSFLQVLFLHVCFRSKFNIRKISTAVGGGFLVDFSVYSRNKTISRDFINAISFVFVWGQFTISKTELEI